MNILFLTMNPFKSIDMHNIYSDLMKVFIAHGHRPYIVTPREKQTGEKTELLEFQDYAILKVRIGNTSNVSFIEKGISTVLLESQFKRAIDKYLGNVNFELILYSTPPITLAGVVKSLKRKTRATTYLMLKDIFPQNAVDIGLFSAKSPIHWYFRQKEMNLYKISDHIGCMSPANVEYVREHNPLVDTKKVEILPNAVIPKAFESRERFKQRVRERYNIPSTSIIYLFGGNLGKPQGIPFLVDCLKANANKFDRYFIICGTGSETPFLELFLQEIQPNNVLLLNGLPKQEYDELASGCDVGLLFLDYRFTIPNFPSRILSYMESGMPVISCTDPNTDVGEIVEENGFGYSCHSNSVTAFTKCIDKMSATRIEEMGLKARHYLEENYRSESCFQIIMNHLI